MAHLTAEIVEKAMSLAREKAASITARVCIVVVDAGGNLAGFLRMEEAFLASSGIAQDKAWTAASFRMSTRQLGDMLQNAERSVRDGLLRRPEICEVPGGVPILREGVMIGAVGVSGGSAEEDEIIAECCLAAFA